LHLYFTHLADALNEAGYNVQLVLKEKVEIDWTPELVKEVLWRTTQKVLLGKISTKELSKQEDIDRITRHLGEKFGIHVEFPSHEIGYWETAPLRN
jgi:hypothetical protein